MAEIVEVFDDIKDKIGDKAFYILIACAGAFGLYNLTKSGSSEGSESLDSTRVVTAVASYPDAITNADVIISSLQNSIDFSENQIKEEIQGLGDEMTEYLQQNFEATNNYINDGLESQKQLMEENMETIMGSLDDIEEKAGTVQYVYSGYSGGGSSSPAKTEPAKTEPAKTTTTQKSTSTKKDTTEYYTYKTKSGYNTSTSIVDALKVSTGNYDSADTAKTLKEVAKANGISNYTGTYNQNVTLLSKLKSGTLKKA